MDDETLHYEQFESSAIDGAAASDSGTIHLNPFVQGHGGIETRLHYVRDWTYDEDRSQVRTQQGPQVMATLRNTAIGLLRHLKLPNISRAVKHLDRHPEQIAALVLG